MMAGKTIVIADGHHRYEAARDAFQKGQRCVSGVLSCLFALDSNEVRIKPFHRHVKGISPYLLSCLPSLLSPDFSIEKHASLDSLSIKLKSEPPGSPDFGAYTPSIGFMSFSPKRRRDMCSTEILHEEVLAKRLEFGRLPFMRDDGQGRIVRARVNFTPSMGSCIEAVDNGWSQAAFFTVPPSARQVFEMARSRRLMPEKSTCFYPKPVEGLIMSSHRI
jgi:uncharacterized protein (DUF1015 family)